MATSPYLHSDSLMDAVKSYLTPKVVQSASAFSGESESATQRTFENAVPSLLGGLANMASSPNGVTDLASMSGDSRFGSILSNMPGIFSGGSTSSNMMSAGKEMLGKIFGNHGTQVTDAVAKSGGVSASSAGKIMGLLAPITMAVLGKMGSVSGLSSSGLANLLIRQKGEFAAAAPAELSSVFNASRVQGPTPVYRGVSHEEERRPRSRSWLPLVLLGLAIIGLLWFFQSRYIRNTGRGATEAVRGAGNAVGGAFEKGKESLSNLVLPGGAGISVARGSMNYDLANYLRDPSATVPKNFTFDHLNFETNSAQLTPDSITTVSTLSTILKAYPRAQVRLTGFTDNTGDPASNQSLSLARADRVKQMLGTNGISSDRISTVGSGADNPVASNDTEEGRAKNRRLELTVVAK